MRRSDTKAATRWMDGKTVGNSMGIGSLGKEGDGSDEGVTDRKTVGNTLLKVSVGKERDGSDDKVDGMENRGEIVWGEIRGEGTRMEATTGWTQGKPWEIA